MVLSRYNLARSLIRLIIVCVALGGSMSAPALDLIPDFFKNTKINRYVWRLQEQHVALSPQAEDMSGLPKNQHPIILDVTEVRDALNSLELWVDGGFFRNEEAVPVFSSDQVSSIYRYIVEALAEAKPDEDVIFNVKGYGAVAFDIVREKFWTSGRVFYANDKLNVIIGSYQVRKDRGKRQAEGAHGVLDDYSDLHFDHGGRDDKAKMPGRIVTTTGVQLSDEHGAKRPDWVQIDVAAASAAYQDSLIPDAERKREAKVKSEAAKLTVERRQMREEMARLRKELDNIKSGGAQVQGLEQRLSTLQELKDKDLISDAEFNSRRKAILEEI